MPKRWIFKVHLSDSSRKSDPNISIFIMCCCSVANLCSTLCDSLDCSTLDSFCPPLPSGVCPNFCPLSWWCYLTISSSTTPFYFCLQSFPATESFPMSQFFSSGGWSTGASASVAVFLLSIQAWFSLGLTGLMSLQSKRHLGVFSRNNSKHLLFSAQPSFFFFFPSALLRPKVSTLTRWTAVNKKYCHHCSQPSLWSNFHIHAWLPGKKRKKLWLYEYLSAKWCLCFLIKYLGLSYLSFNFMASVTICSNFGAQGGWGGALSWLPLLPLLFAMSDGTRCLNLCCFNVDFQAKFFTFLFHPHQEVL